MTQGTDLIAYPSLQTPNEWWASRRLRYNIALLVAGPVGFVCYAGAVDRCIDLGAPGDWEITIFTTFFQGIAYLLMIGLANLCYNLGPWSERLFRPKKLERYRHFCFRLGFWFSILLVFVPCILLLLSCHIHLGQEQKLIL